MIIKGGAPGEPTRRRIDTVLEELGVADFPGIERMGVMTDVDVWIGQRVRQLRDQLAIFSGGWEHELWKHLEDVVMPEIERLEQCMPNGDPLETA